MDFNSTKISLIRARWAQMKGPPAHFNSKIISNYWALRAQLLLVVSTNS